MYSKIIGIVGARCRNTELDYCKTRKAFWSVARRGDLIVSGGCHKGGDWFAERIASVDRFPIRVHLPNKSKLDSTLALLNYRAAYAQIAYARNVLIANDADVLIAVVAPDRKGGTEHTIKCFLKKISTDEPTAVQQKKLVLV